MRKPTHWIVMGLLSLFTSAMVVGAERPEKVVRPISWKRCLTQKSDFYGSDEGIRIADNVLLYQRNTGGWAKGIDMARVLSEDEKGRLRGSKNRQDAILDNGATHTQIRYLARVYSATRLERFKQAFLKGVDYLLEAQYDNGGWPQKYPNPGGYSRYITFNDYAMIGAMSVLRDIAEKKSGYKFVDEGRRRRAEEAVRKGIECILKCQIIVGGRRTAWCQQHDEKTLEPRPARTYEKVSICGGESVGIVRFLMSIDKPDVGIIKAIEGAVAWFDRAKIRGIRQVNKPDDSERGYDKVVIKDATAPPIWARFYQIGTNRPLFCGRDGKIRYSLAEIEHERRTGYSWYGYGPAELLAKDYPAWRKKWADQAKISQTRVQGRIRGTSVTLDTAVFKNSIFHVFTGSGWYENPSVLIFLKIKKGIIPNSKSFSVEPKDGLSGLPHIHYRWRDAESGRIISGTGTGTKYKLSLKFSEEANGRIPGSILLEIPEKDIRVEGNFDAKIEGLRLIDGHPDLLSDDFDTLTYATELYLERKKSSNVEIVKRSRATMWLHSQKKGILDVEYKVGDHETEIIRVRLAKGPDGWKVVQELRNNQLFWAHPLEPIDQQTADRSEIFNHLTAKRLEEQLQKEFPGKGLYFSQYSVARGTKKGDIRQVDFSYKVEGIKESLKKSYLFRLTEGEWVFERELKEGEALNRKTGVVERK